MTLILPGHGREIADVFLKANSFYMNIKTYIVIIDDNALANLVFLCTIIYY